MSFDLKRRDVLKLAVFFAAVWTSETARAMDGAPRFSTEGKTGSLTPSSSPSGADQNGYAIDGSSNFLAVYRDPQLRAAFYLFLQNVYHIYPEDKFHKLIEEATAAHASDREIYRFAQSQVGTIKPFLGDIRYALPALAKQKAEMVRQTMELLGAPRRIDGYLEIGTTGRYISRLRSDIEVTGDIVLVHSVSPSYSPEDIVERGGLTKVGRFVSLEDYAPIAASAVPDRSCDLVTNFIGFHHSPPSRRDAFVKSVHRVLRAGGRLIVRDHDVNSKNMNRIVALAHDVFNMGLHTDWLTNQNEIRNFTSMRELKMYLEGFGFKADSRALLQDGDPTHNALMIFTKV